MIRSLFFYGIILLLCLNYKAKAQDQTVLNGGATTAITFGGPGCIFNWSNNNPSIGLPANGTGNIASFKAVNTGIVPVKATITANYTAPPQMAFIVNQLNNNITVIDPIIMKVLFGVNTGSEPYGIAINSDASRVYVANRTAGTVSVIKTSAKLAIATVTVGVHPEGIAVNPDGSKVYVANYEDGSVSVINTADNTVIKTITSVGLHPSGVVVSNDGSKIFVTETSANKVFVIDAVSNTISANINVGIKPAGIVQSIDGSRLYVANTGSNNLTVINTATNSVVTNVITGAQPFGVAISPDGSTVYVSNTGSDDVTVINTADNSKKNNITVGTSPRGVSVTPDGKSVYVVNFGSDNVSVINTTTSATTSFAVGNQPFSFGNFMSGARGCSSVPVTIVITVDPTPPTIASTLPLQALTTSQGIPSTATTFNVSGSSLTAGILVKPPAGFEVSIDNINFFNSLTVGTAGNIESTPVYIRLSENDLAGNYNGDIILTSTGATTVNVTMPNSTVTAPVPAITVTKALGAISGCAGSPSVSPYVQKFTVAGVNLVGILAATAPAGFEVSLNENTGYTANITIGNGGNTGYKDIYVRSSGSLQGNISGKVQLSSPGTTSKTVDVAGTVNILPVVNPVSDVLAYPGTATNLIEFSGTGNAYSWINNTPGIGLPASGMGNIKPFIPVNNGSTHIVATVTVIPLSAPLAYVTNFNANSVTAINTLTNTPVATFGVGSLPQAVIVSPDASRAYVANYNSSDVSVINTGTNKVIATIKVGIQPVALEISPDGSVLSVYNMYEATVTQISTATNTIIATTDAGKYPPGTAFSKDGKTAYPAEYVFGTVSAINTVTGQTIKAFNVITNYGGVVISPDGTRLYISNAKDNSVWIINTANNNTITTIPTGLNPNGISLNADGSRLYVATPNTNSISVYNTATLAAVALNIPTDQFPVQVGNTPGTGCNGNAITFKITVMPTPPTITTAGTLPDLTTTVGTASASASFDLSGIKLTAGILVTPPPGYEVSDDDVNFSPAITIGTAPTVSGVPVYIRLAASTPVGTYNGNITLSSPGATNVQVAINGAVTPAIPTLAASAVTGVIYACAGTPSASPNLQQFKVSGSLLTNDIIVDAPAGFEVSVSMAGGFSNSLTIARSGNAVASTVIYVRSAASALGSISGSVQVRTAGGVSKFASVKGSVTALPTVNPISDQGLIPGGTATAAVNFTGNANTYNWVNDQPGVGLAATGSGDIASFTAINNTSNTITANVTVTPLIAPYAYVATQNGIALLNTGNNEVISNIATGLVAYGVAVSADGKWIYVSNQNSNTISIINTVTNKKVDDYAVGSNPTGIAVSPDGSRIYVANRNSNTVSIINTITKAINTVNVGISPLGVVISPDGSYVYVANQSSNTVSIINTTTNLVTNIPVGKSPDGLAVTPDGSMLYVCNYNDKTVWAISTETFAPIAKINVNNNPRGVAISPDGGQVYVTNFGSNNVSIISTVTNSVITTVTVGNSPLGVSFTPDGSKVYVANYGSNSMSLINTVTKAVTTVKLSSAPISFGSFITGGSGCSGNPITFKITVAPGSSNISFTGTLSPLTTIYGTPSASTSFSVSGVTMPAGILVTPPTGFQASLDNVNYSATVTVGAAGTIPATTVYIRLAAVTPAGTYSGNVILSSTSGSPVNVPTANSIVNTTALTIKADDKTKITGQSNPTFTITYTGFVNGEGAAQLTKQPTVTTTATTASPIGQYPITVTNAASNNYSFVYIPGVFTISDVAQPLLIPNTFTPNGDGINDIWEIKNLATYPGSTVDIFDRYGLKVYSSFTAAVIWDGRFRGTMVPAGTYYYLIDLKNKQKPVAGSVTVIR